ncbi:MAG: glycoside hydrolase N-terminal domain-containing protein [Thermoguttaceae bacterium]|jgi:hypothetical protein
MSIAARAASPEPAANIAALMPAHGTVSIAPADKWEDSLATGNGIMGALLAGDPRHDTLIVNHCKMWLPLGSREMLPDVGKYLPEIRKIIAEKGYGEAQKFFEARAKEQGWGGKIIWTDPFHPAFFLKIDQPASGDIAGYARVEDFSTGEVWAQWRTIEGEFSHRVFVSRTDNVLVLKLAAPKGRLSCSLTVPKVGNDKIDSGVVHAKDLITLHNVYVKGKGGYDCAVRVAVTGGTVQCDGQSIRLVHADSATLVMRVEPYKAGQAAPLAGLTRSLTRLTMDYEALLKPHALAHGEIFNRVAVDLGGAPGERRLASEPLLDLAKKEKRLPAALLERMYDAGRYEFLCAAGPDTPPNLFGIWTGTWAPAWSGDYTLDTNLQLDIESAFSGNMAECMAGYFKLLEGFVPDFQANAHKLYGCRGILSGSRASNTGLHLHWGSGWPGQAWTPGASWLAHWFYDYYQYSGDRKFLRDHAVPYMKQCALFWEDFLKGTEDANGKFHFSPSFSAENGLGDNATQDIAITRELLTNLIAACETLAIEAEGVKRWKAMLAKLPPYLINEKGQLKEWAIPNKGENNNHRHLMHLYGAFESQEFSEEADPKLFRAARVALNNRLREARETATHGRMHMALSAAALGMGSEAYGRLQLMATDRSMYASMITAHNDGPSILCDDGNGSIPEIVNRLAVQSKPGRLMLLPALPDALARGSICGTRARGQLGVGRISWDMKAGTLTAVLTSEIDQTIDVVLPPGMVVERLTADGKVLPVVEQGVRKQGCKLALSKGVALTLDAKFHADRK